ncbi:MAG: hypothetical protein PHP08_03290 [Candidatus Dojkabacteria bacterium]|nr:hypothetical protein [Candidatus Dojkabacteria bacterium]
MKINRLYIDETGQLSGSTGYYILVGCVISDDKKETLKILSGQIKYKYWDNDAIVFHSQDMGKCMGNFKNLKDSSMRNSFHHDLFKFLSISRIIIFPIVLDKKSITSKRWGKRRKLQTMSRNLFKNFILFTMSSSQNIGKITVESSSLSQDYYYHEALNHYKANGIKELKIKGKDISQSITSLSFVNKSNGDIEEQIADIFAYGVKCKLSVKKYPKNSYEAQLINVLEKKMFKMPLNAKDLKKKMLSEIDPFVVIK